MLQAWSSVYTSLFSLPSSISLLRLPLGFTSYLHHFLHANWALVFSLFLVAPSLSVLASVLASPTAVYSSFLQFSTFLFINCVYLLLLPHCFISLYTSLSVCITMVLLHCRLGFWVSRSKWRAACLDNYSVRIKPYWLMLFFLFVL